MIERELRHCIGERRGGKHDAVILRVAPGWPATRIPLQPLGRETLVSGDDHGVDPRYGPVTRGGDQRLQDATDRPEIAIGGDPPGNRRAP